MPLYTNSVSSIAGSATLVFTSDKGVASLPQRILIQNQDATNSVAVGGADVAYGSAPHIAPGGNFEVALESGESVYVRCDTAQTATCTYIVTRH